MKVWKKIVPFVGIASSLAIVTPILTSCGWMSDFDYKPTITQHQATIYANEKEAANEYFEKIEQNNEIFVQDYYWSFASECKEERDRIIKAGNTNIEGKFSVKMTNLNIRHVDHNGQKIYLISAKLNEKTKHSYQTELPNETIKRTQERDTILELKNMPFQLIYHEGITSNWIVQYSPLKDFVNDWSCRAHGYLSEDVTHSTKKGGNTDHTKNEIDYVYNKDTEPFDTGFSIYSYYFYQVKLA